MKHDVTEIYSIKKHISANNFYCTLEYCENNNVSIYDSRKNPKGVARRCGAILASSAQSFKWHDANGVMHIGYLYGEHVWFDTKEERDNYRAVQNAKREAEKARNKVKNEIIDRLNDMSVEQLEMLLAKL